MYIIDLTSYIRSPLSSNSKTRIHSYKNYLFNDLRGQLKYTWRDESYTDPKSTQFFQKTGEGKWDLELIIHGGFWKN